MGTTRSDTQLRVEVPELSLRNISPLANAIGARSARGGAKHAQFLPWNRHRSVNSKLNSIACAAGGRYVPLRTRAATAPSWLAVALVQFLTGYDVVLVYKRLAWRPTRIADFDNFDRSLSCQGARPCH